MSRITNAFSRAFNWKKNPGGVFFTAIPLAMIGLALTFFQAYLMWSYFDDFIFMIIWLVGIVVGAVALYPAYKILKRSEGNDHG